MNMLKKHWQDRKETNIKQIKAGTPLQLLMVCCGLQKHLTAVTEQKAIM